MLPRREEIKWLALDDGEAFSTMMEVCVFPLRASKEGILTPYRWGTGRLLPEGSQKKHNIFSPSYLLL